MSERKPTLVFRIPEGFEETAGMEAIFSGNIKAAEKIAENVRQTVELFHSHGYKIRRGGKFNPTNPWELAISYDRSVRARTRYQEAAEEAGLLMPHTHTPREALATPSAVVAKIPEADTGDLKYLLDTEDQKVKFIAWALIFQNMGNLVNEQNPEATVERIFNKVKGGRFTDRLIRNQGWLNHWLFEEFVETPGDYYTSLRVVADAYGNVYYGQIARSENRKDSQVLMPVPKLRYRSNPLKELTRVGRSLDSLLQHPGSPFYIAPKRFISNIAAGGSRLLLSGESVVNEEDRRLLEDLRINPDKLEIPDQLVTASQKIGILYRKYYPFVGIDFIQRRGTGEYLLLEVNTGPGLSPHALGLPENTPPWECQLEMMKKVIASAPKFP